MQKSEAPSKLIPCLAGGGVVICSSSVHATATQVVMQVPDALPLSVVIYYTFAATLFVIYTLAMSVSRFWSGLAYSGYGVLMLSLVGAMDGTIAYLINGTNWIMLDAPLFIAALAIAYGFVHVAMRIPAAHWAARGKPVIVGLAAFGLLLIPAYWIIGDMPLLYAIVNLLLVVMVFSQVLAAGTAPAIATTGYRVAYFWPLIIGIALVVLYAVDLGGGSFSRATVDQINRTLILGHLLHLMLLACLLLVEEVRAKQAAEQKALQAGRQAAEASLALERTQHEFERVQRLAADRSRTLATASHDLKQPIAALRMALVSSKEDSESGNTQRISDAIDYLDQLAGSYLSEGRQGIDVEQQPEDAVDQAQEQVGLDLIAQTVAAMFQHEADAQGVEIRVRASPTTVLTNPLALTRALSNAVANVLAHAGASKILIGSRRTGGRVSIEVLDNGRGMDAAAIDRVTQYGVRGEDSQGSGLGLGIVAALAEEHDWTFKFDSHPGKGTVLRLALPMA